MERLGVFVLIVTFIYAVKTAFYDDKPMLLIAMSAFVAIVFVSCGVVNCLQGGSFFAKKKYKGDNNPWN